MHHFGEGEVQRGPLPEPLGVALDEVVFRLTSQDPVGDVLPGAAAVDDAVAGSFRGGLRIASGLVNV